MCNLTHCRIKMPDLTTEAKEESSPAKELGLGMSHEEGREDLQQTYKT